MKIHIGMSTDVADMLGCSSFDAREIMERFEFLADEEPLHGFKSLDIKEDR